MNQINTSKDMKFFKRALREVATLANDSDGDDDEGKTKHYRLSEEE